MEDQTIIELYWARSEQAISETQRKYGSYCRSIARNILDSPEDVEETLNDTYLAVWNAIPPQRPNILATFLGKLTRHLAIDRLRANHAWKRGGAEPDLALEELAECLADPRTLEARLEGKRLLDVLNRFLGMLPEQERRIFLCRYWYLDPLDTIAGHYGYSVSKVASILHRTRKKLRKLLEKEELL